MDSRKRPKRRNEDTIPCECGCGTLILKYGTDRRIRRFFRGHQFKGNTSGQKPYSLETILSAVEPLRPLCACGCGERLRVPQFMQQKGHGVKGILSYWQRHPYSRGHGIWEKRTENFVDSFGSLSTASLGLVYGTLLGDCAITFPNAHSRFPRLAWTHSRTQQAWSEYKASRLPELRPSVRDVDNSGYGESSSVGCTACHPELLEIFQVVNPDRQGKRVSADWLKRITPEGIAWWYMDDGSLSLTPRGSPSIQLHTEGFGLEENQLIASWLSALGYSAKASTYVRSKTGRSYHYISMGAVAAGKFLADFKPFAIPSMAYKFRDR